jgi:hypothetical protein
MRIHHLNCATLCPGSRQVRELDDPASGSIVLSSGSAGARPHKRGSDAASVTGTVDAVTRSLAVELAR